jgi:hypothetical protein
VHSVYGLLAMFPVLALPLLMGGVTVGEFWRVVSVLVATLFLSLSMGMFVSAAVRESRQAMAGTFLGMLLTTGAPWAVWSLGEILCGAWQPGAFLWPSPINAFIYALDSYYRVGKGPWEFWGSLQTVLGLGVGLLVLAAILLPRAWQEKAGSAPAVRGPGKTKASGQDHYVRRVARPRALLDANPYLWLASRTRSCNVFTAILFGLLLLLWFCSLVVSVVVSGRRSAQEAFTICFLTAYALHQVGKYQAAVEASQQLSEDRQSGALELLLITPLGEAQILSGQKRALQRRSRGLQMVLLLVNVCLCLAVVSRPGQLHMNARDQALFLELFVGGIVVLFVDFWALHTVGMCMAVRARKHHRAVLGTLGRMMLVPWAGIFLWVFLMMTRASGTSESELAMIFALWFTAGIINDLVVEVWARAGLGRGLRYWVAEGRMAGDREPFPPLGSSIAKGLYA